MKPLGQPNQPATGSMTNCTWSCHKLKSDDYVRCTATYYGQQKSPPTKKRNPHQSRQCVAGRKVNPKIKMGDLSSPQMQGLNWSTDLDNNVTFDT